MSTAHFILPALRQTVRNIKRLPDAIIAVTATEQAAETDLLAHTLSMNIILTLVTHTMYAYTVNIRQI